MDELKIMLKSILLQELNNKYFGDISKLLKRINDAIDYCDSCNISE